MMQGFQVCGMGNTYDTYTASPNHKISPTSPNAQ